MVVQSDSPAEQNQSWRPPGAIRAKVIAVARHDNRMLVCEVLDDAGTVKGWCPLGGGVEFGEPAEKALKREIQEELGCDILISGAPVIFENIFEHHGAKGHEIVFAYPVRFNDPKLYTKTRFQMREDSGTMHWVEWIDMEDFKNGTAILFPTALGPFIFST
jgi:ADP-ribose pyrophosphatase YjhB (NUDIX family)